MSSDFSDVADAELREQCLGFLEQIRSGKPASVINMVMKSRNVPQNLIDRVNKAAGTSGGAGGGGGSSGGGGPAANEIKQKAKSKSSDASDEKEVKKKKKEKKKKDKDKEKQNHHQKSSADSNMFGESSDEENSVFSPADSGESEKKHKRKKKDRERDREREKADPTSSSSSSAAAVHPSHPPSFDRLTSIEALDQGKSRKPKKNTAGAGVDSDAFAKKHGVDLQRPNVSIIRDPASASTSNSNGKQKQPEPRLRAYDDATDDDGTELNEKMYGIPDSPKKKDGCIIC